MKRYDVSTTVCPSKAAAAGLLLWVRRAGDIDRLLQKQWVNVDSATLSTYILMNNMFLNCFILGFYFTLRADTIDVLLT